MTDASAELDDIDRAIIDRLRSNAREPAASIAKDVRITAGAVRRRINRLEKRGVIAGYTVSLDHDKTGTNVEAYIELSFAGGEDVHAILAGATEWRPQVREAMVIAGEPDAIVRVRVSSLTELRELVMDLRRAWPVTATRTRIVIGRWWHGSNNLTGG